MKAVILAAGKSTRCLPITQTVPKPLVKICNKSLIFYTLESLKGIVDEIIIVVGYMADAVMKEIGNKYNGIPIKYIEQKETIGTGHAVFICESFVGDDFLVINGDDLYSKKDFLAIAKLKDSMLLAKAQNPKAYGCVDVKDNAVVAINEKPENPKTNLVNTGLYHFTAAIFDYIKKLKPSARGELEIVDAISMFAKDDTFRYAVVEDYWLPNSYVWQFLDTNAFLLSRMKSKIEGTVEHNVEVKGKLILGKGSVIKSGTYIEGDVLIGENTTIGPNCYIRGATTIGNNANIKNCAEIKNSIIMDGFGGGHFCYIGDSILGNNVNLGAGTMTANWRHDNLSVKSMVNDALVDTGRRKLGTIVGDNVHTGINTSIYPGRKLWPNTVTVPGEVVKQDKLS